MLAGSTMLALSSANALETTLYCFLVTLLVRRLVGGRGTAAPFATGMLAALVVVTRPDGVLVVAALALTSLLLEPGRPRRARSPGHSAAWSGRSACGRDLRVHRSPVPEHVLREAPALGRAVTEGARYLQTAIAPRDQAARRPWDGECAPPARPVGFVVTGAVVLVRSRSRMVLRRRARRRPGRVRARVGRRLDAGRSLPRARARRVGRRRAQWGRRHGRPGHPLPTRPAPRRGRRREWDCCWPRHSCPGPPRPRRCGGSAGHSTTTRSWPWAGTGSTCGSGAPSRR